MSDYKVVPVEPTEEMLVAGAEQVDWYENNARDCYDAMLAAAPAPSGEAVPNGWREFLQFLIERCEHGDVNEDCDDPDWRHIYLTAKAMLAHPPAERDAEDAARYRWLRNGRAKKPKNAHKGDIQVLLWQTNAEAEALKGCVLDAAIDAARQGEGK